MRNRERGITLIGWLVLLIPVAIVGYAALRVTPLYLNYMKVSKGLEQLASESKGDDQVNVAAMQTALGKHFEIDNVDYPPVDAVKFQRDGKAWFAEAKYEDVVPLFAQISLLVKFDKRVQLTSPAAPN